MVDLKSFSIHSYVFLKNGQIEKKLLREGNVIAESETHPISTNSKHSSMIQIIA